MGRVSVLRVHSTCWPCAPWQRREDGEEALPSRRARALGTFGQSLSTVLPALASQGGSAGQLSPLPSVQCPVSFPGGAIRSQGGGPGEPPVPRSRLGPAVPLPLGSRWGHSPASPPPQIPTGPTRLSLPRGCLSISPGPLPLSTEGPSASTLLPFSTFIFHSNTGRHKPDPYGVQFKPIPMATSPGA